MTTPKLTLKQAKIECRAIGITLTKQDGEYRVAYRSKHIKISNEKSAYYTYDIEDALRTAKAMAEWKLNRDKKKAA